MSDEAKRVGKLETAIDCRRELARVYRESRRGKVPTSDATRYANILNILVSMIRDSDLEARLKLIEEHFNGN